MHASHSSPAYATNVHCSLMSTVAYAVHAYYLFMILPSICSTCLPFASCRCRAARHQRHHTGRVAGGPGHSDPALQHPEGCQGAGAQAHASIWGPCTALQQQQQYNWYQAICLKPGGYNNSTREQVGGGSTALQCTLKFCCPRNMCPGVYRGVNLGYPTACTLVVIEMAPSPPRCAWGDWAEDSCCSVTP
jgi:hypothetical protein